MVVSRIQFIVFCQKHEVFAPFHLNVKEMASVKVFVRSFYETAYIANVDHIEVSEAEYENHSYESGKPRKAK
jgi:hypothetical protein